MISLDEQNRRREAVEYAIATCEISGCVFSTEQKALYQRYIDGEISLEELGNIVRKDLPQE